MQSSIKIWPNKKVDPDFCQHLIRRFDADPRVQDDPQPDYSTRRFLMISGRKDWSEECRTLNRLVDEHVRLYFKGPKRFRSVTPERWGNDGFLIARYAPGDVCVLHVDGQCAVPPQNQVRILTFLLYLNTVQKGGETIFPYQDLKIAPEQGKIAIFPPGHSFPHEVTAPQEARDILQTWIVDPDLFVVPKQEYKRAKH